MAHFIPSAGVHTKGSYNSTTAPLTAINKAQRQRIVTECRRTDFLFLFPVVAEGNNLGLAHLTL
jgi:hypothetical protein